MYNIGCSSCGYRPIDKLPAGEDLKCEQLLQFLQLRWQEQTVNRIQCFFRITRTSGSHAATFDFFSRDVNTPRPSAGKRPCVPLHHKYSLPHQWGSEMAAQPYSIWPHTTAYFNTSVMQKQRPRPDCLLSGLLRATDLSSVNTRMRRFLL